jgi:hypothetical protein
MRAAAALSLLVLLAAGCASPDGGDAVPGAGATTGADGDGSTETTGSATSGPVRPAPDGNASAPATASAGLPTLTLDGCRNFGAVFPVAMDTARAALPAGFEPVPTPSDPAGGATLYVLALRCEGSSVDGAATGPVDAAYAELAVVPPAERAVAGRTDATVPLVFTASVPAVGEALAALGFGIAGPGEVGWAEHTGAGDLIVSAGVGGASFTLRGAYSPASLATAGSGGFVLYGAQDGQVVSTVLGEASGGGEAVDAAVTLESAGLDLLAAARPAARGFSVSGFSLSFTPA